MSMKKCVNFDLTKNNTLYMIAWGYAYKQARRGQWEMLARDRNRFQRRIQEAFSTISAVLDPIHRNRIYFERYGNE